MIAGFFVRATYLIKGIWLFSNDAILYKGTSSFSKKSTASS